MTVVVQEEAITEPLRRALSSAVESAARRGEPPLVSITIAMPSIDPASLFEAAEAEERAFWEQPQQQFSMVAIGAAAHITGAGADRFGQATAAWRRLTAGAIASTAEGCPVHAPVCLGGFAFEPKQDRNDSWRDYADALLTVPRLLFVSYDGASWLIASTLAGPEGTSEAEDVVADVSALLARSRAISASEPPQNGVAIADEHDATEWKQTVADVVREIRSGAVRKLVLARQVSARSEGPLATSAMLRRLRSRYESCTTFAFAHGESCFLGATPERLVRLDGRTVRVDCLAGSAPRGATEDEDRSLAEALLSDKKELHEHALVVDALRESLAPLSSDLDVPEGPRLLSMPNVQHLHTPVEGTLAEDRHVLELVARLHPTPAAGGVPQQAACDLIPSFESFDRGWYAGPVGWVDGHGGGEFVVAIRSALLRGQEALLYAGCGIVEGSDPEREYRESCLKLKPMLWAMNGR